MGSVYRCHNKDSARILAAVKVLAGSLRADDAAVARFVREAEILHRLDHPSVVKVRNVRVDAEPPYLEMEFVDGPHLGELLGGGALPVSTCVKYGRQLFEALGYLHENQVRHRDIKPDNLLIRDGQLVLVDFGLALDAAVTRLTADNMAFGTVAYAPPEWLRPSEIDPAAWDLYAAGVVLWEMLTGEEPFPASGEGAPRHQALQVMLGKQTAPPLDPGPEFPLALRRMIGNLTCVDPDERYQTAAEVLEEFPEIERTIEHGWDPSVAPIEFGAITRESDLSEPPARASGSLPVLGSLGADKGVSQSIQIPEGPKGTPLWVFALAVVGVAAIATVAIGLVRSQQVEDDPMLADLVDDRPVSDVVLTLPQLEHPDWLAIALDGRLPVDVSETEARFEEIPVGPQTIEWTYGQGCALNACPGEGCAEWCGNDQVVVEIDADAENNKLPLAIAVPSREVSVLVRALTVEPRKGLFKKDPPRPWGYLAGVRSRWDGELVWFDDIPPGEHQMILAMGSCPADAAGCSRSGTCPSGCASERRTVKVGWDDEPLSLASNLPMPE